MTPFIISLPYNHPYCSKLHIKITLVARQWPTINVSDIILDYTARSYLKSLAYTSIQYIPCKLMWVYILYNFRYVFIWVCGMHVYVCMHCICVHTLYLCITKVVFAPGSSLDVFRTGEWEEDEADYSDEDSDHDSDSDDDILSNRARISVNSVSYHHNSLYISIIVS